MKKARRIIIGLIVMAAVSVTALLILSAVTYVFKWQADKALIGITITYILAGICGGLSLTWMSKNKSGEGEPVKVQEESVNMAGKMLEAIGLSTLFMLLLLCLSVFVLHNPFSINGHLLMIWMLLAGSACLGRIV